MKKLLLFISTFVLTTATFAQTSSILFNGYVKELTMYYKPVEPVPISSTESIDYLLLNQFHNRLNFKWFASDKFTFTLEARNRLFFGQMVRKFPEYAKMIEMDDGFFDLSKTLISEDNWFLHTIVDRVYLDYTAGKWQFRAGRQRVNWGINLVWNPNDVFNTYSYFDFDYEERPGTDAVKIQYYTGVTSSAELVYKIGKNVDSTAVAGMFRFSKFDYDFQFMGGWVGKDMVMGGGWSGDIKGGGFRGEFTWFIPRGKTDLTNYEAFVASVSGDYTFKNSLYLHGSVLFNSYGTTGDAGGRDFLTTNDISAKMLSLGRYNLFGQASYPFTPLFSANFSAMFNPCDKSSYLGPSLNYSLGNNLELMVNGQLFTGKTGTEYGDYGKAIFGRIKWSF